MVSKEISCVGDFLKVVKEIYPKNERAYFRGQSSSLYDVNSSLCRLIEGTKEGQPENYPYFLSTRLFKEFKNNVPAYSEHNLLKDYKLNEIDLMMVAQHYGLATRLIDWTKNPLVALYFATERQRAEVDASVYVVFNVPEIKPVTITSSQIFADCIKDEQEKLDEIYKLIEKNIGIIMTQEIAHTIYGIVNSSGADFLNPPVQISKEILSMHMVNICFEMVRKKIECCDVIRTFQKSEFNTTSALSSVCIHNDAKYVLEPLPLNSRIKNQQGVFIFSNQIDTSLIENKKIPRGNIIDSYDEALDDFDPNEGVVRIDIPAKYLKSIHEELNLYGVTKDFIYPELPSYTETMQKRIVRDVRAGKIL